MNKEQVDPIKLCRELFAFACHGDYSNGITGNEGTVDEGCVRAGERLDELEKQLIELEQSGYRLIKDKDVAVKDERERILTEIEKYRSETTREFMGFTMSREQWQALKEGK